MTDEHAAIESAFGDPLSGELTTEHDQDEVSAYATAIAATPPQWWQKPYAGGPPAGPAKLVRPLYFPGNPSRKPASSAGPDVLAVKRAVWRGGRWPGPSASFDSAFSKAFALGKSGNVGETGLAGFQRQMGFQPTGQMGDETYQALRYARVPETLPNGGQPLFDSRAVELLNQAAAPPPPKPPSADAVRSAIALYCRGCIDNAPGWHYRQARAMDSLGRAPQAGGYSDCSEHATAAYYWAKIQTGIAVPDPNGRGFDGYGYTGTLINNPTATSPYQIGDLALYGSSPSATQHVCTCYVAGDAKASRWCSHGSENGPYDVTLNYRSDLLRVARPKLIP